MYGSPYDGSLCTATVYPDSAGQLQENPQTGDWTLNTTAPTLKLRVGGEHYGAHVKPARHFGPSIYMGNPSQNCLVANSSSATIALPGRLFPDLTQVQVGNTCFIADSSGSPPAGTMFTVTRSSPLKSLP